MESEQPPRTFMTDLQLTPQPIENIVCTRPHPAADASVAEKLSFFREAGYVIVEHALQGKVLRATQAEFSAGAEEMRPLWEDATRTGNDLVVEGYGPMKNVPTEWFDIPRYAERGPASLNLLNNPKNMEVRAPANENCTGLAQIVGQLLRL